MSKRFVAIWFRHLKTDWLIKRNPRLKDVPFALALTEHGRMMITDVSAAAKTKSIRTGMIVADAKVLYPELDILNDIPGLDKKLLNKIALWCIRYTPFAAIDPPDGIILDITGCTHLWGTEEAYLKEILSKLKGFGYYVRTAMADTIGTAWAISRYGKIKAIIKSGEEAEALMSLPPNALRIDTSIIERLKKLGLDTIGSFINMEMPVLRRRFGQDFLLRLNQALGNKEEYIQTVLPVNEYSERLPCFEPVQTKTAIEIALEKLLGTLCKRLRKEAKGLRCASLIAYRIDNKIEKISISTNHASNNNKHLFKLFELKIETIEPALGIELFVLEATKVEDVIVVQQTLWSANNNIESNEIAELLDNLENKFGNDIINRYLPDEHHWPERSVKLATSLKEKPAIEWSQEKLRPIKLLPVPEFIQVTAPVPDYPPMNFRYKGTLYEVSKSDACERIEAEWWLDGGLHRDYYIVEDKEGKRYWLYRLGHYNEEEKPEWFIHGFFE